MGKAVAIRYSGFGSLGETCYDTFGMVVECPKYDSDTSWWDNWGSTIISIIGTSIIKIGDRYQKIIDDASLKKAMSAATGGGAGSPTQAQQANLAQMLADQAHIPLADAQAEISRLLGGGVKKETQYPSWLMPAAITLVAYVLLTRSGGGNKSGGGA